MNNANGICTFLSICLLLGVSLRVFSQVPESINPQVGTWVIDQEDKGNPGRGFQIDFQKDVLVLYFYGYEETGESTYWLAAGRLAKGSNELTADLGAYEGGMAFGDQQKNATYLGSRGQVTIRFTGFDTGEICLPKEPCKKISAFNFGYETDGSKLLGSWVVWTSVNRLNLTTFIRIVFDDVSESSSPTYIDRVIGTATITIPDSSGGNSGRVRAEVVCDFPRGPNDEYFFCEMSEALGDLEVFSFSVKRNALIGLYWVRGENGLFYSDPEGMVQGVRNFTPAGRGALPN